MGRTISAVAVLAVLLAPGRAAAEAMPVAQQNALVQKYCAICHKDAFPNGGLSLEHFDAARPDPGLAAMLVSKLKNGALGAAGQPLPDRATQDALQSALTAASAGATTWNLHRSQNPMTRADMVTASIVQEMPSTANNGEPDLYRLTVMCDAVIREAEVQVAWSPGVPASGQVMSAAVDGKMLATYKLEGTEKMGNGQDGVSGPGAVVLYTTKKNPGVGLPAQALTVSNVFPNQTVVFPFGALTPATRQALSSCFN